jgi:hypothetical protein
MNFVTVDITILPKKTLRKHFMFTTLKMSWKSKLHSDEPFFRNKIKHRRKIRKISPRLPSVLTWNLMPDSTSVNL